MKRLAFVGIAALAVLLTFGIGYLVAVRILFPPVPEPENGILVPRLAGLSVHAADSVLRLRGLRMTDVVQLAHPRQPAGIVVAQSPLPGQQLREMGGVSVAVSSGLPHAAVPNVLGFAVDRASAVLAAVGFQADQRTEESHEPAGTVIRISPQVGTEQPVPGRLLLVVSSGPPPPPPVQPADSDTLKLPRPDTVPRRGTTE